MVSGYRGPTEQLFWDKVDRSQGCWTWLSGLFKTGYGQFWNGKKNVRAHRYSYELIRGKIPKGLQLDHLCRNPLCVNPHHLEIVTNKENVLRGQSIPANNARKTHCKRGHPLSGDNLYIHDNQRFCVTCRHLHDKKWRNKRGM